MTIWAALREKAARRMRNPDQPWLWRQEWAEGHIPDRAPISPGCLWGFGLLWLAMTSPVLMLNFGRDEGQKLVLAIFRFVFPAAGVAILVCAAFLTLKKWKYGVSYCRLDVVPAEPGRTLRAEIETHVHERPPEGFALTLSCLRRETTRGRQTQTVERVLWQEERMVANVAPGVEGVRVPVAFDLPADVEPTDERDPDDSVVWQLEVSASVPGIDYAARFELPVFFTGEHPVVTTARPSHDDAAAWMPNPRSPIAISVGPHGGEEIRVAAGRSASDWAGVLVFFAFFAGVCFIFDRLGAPAYVIWITGSVGVLFFILVLDFLAGSTIVHAETAGLTIRRWLTRNVPASDIAAIDSAIGFTSGGVAYYDVNVKRANGRTTKAVRYVKNKREAEMIAARLRRAVGK